MVDGHPEAAVDSQAEVAALEEGEALVPGKSKLLSIDHFGLRN